MSPSRKLGMALLIAGASLSARAQVTVSLRLAHGRVLSYEPVEATVSIENQTPAPLYFSDASAETTLGFDISPAPGRLVPRRAAPMFVEPLVVPPRQTESRTFDLVPLYEMGTQGPYTVTARVAWQGELFSSGKAFLDILPGLTVETYRAVLAHPPGARRTFLLKTLARDRQDFLFLRIDDEQNELCYGVINLGTVVRVYKPDMKMDIDDRIHVLHQSAPARFTYSIYTANGQAVAQTYYNATPATARLAVDADGEVDVLGVRPYRGDPYTPPSRTPEEERLQMPAAPPKDRGGR